MARMRTAAGVLEIIKSDDPESEVTLHFIRNIIRSGKIQITPVGRKKLVDADAVIAYIAAGQAPPITVTEGGIRKVTV